MGGAYRGNRPGCGLSLLRSSLFLAVIYTFCQAQEESSPCTTSGDATRPFVYCKNISDFSSVTAMFTSPNTEVPLLLIENSPLIVLTRADIDGPEFKNLQSLNLVRNGFSSFDPLPFQGLSLLTSLDLEGNNITALNADAFSGLGSITSLSINENQITDINPTAFQSLSNLKSLDLNDNELTSITPNMFQGLNQLETLTLDDNLITSIEEGNFIGLDKLNFLTLEGNKITTIDSRAFQTLTSLRFLKLANNKLELLDSRLFENNPLDHLDISYNQLENLANFPLNISSLRMLGLAFGGIVTIPSNYFENVPNLLALGLIGNKISQIDPNTFAHLTELRILTLSKNNLVSLNVDSFQQLNRILNQTPVTIEALNQNMTFGAPGPALEDNPWDCSTNDMVELRSWTSEHNVDFDSLFNCSAVIAVEGVQSRSRRQLIPHMRTG